MYLHGLVKFDYLHGLDYLLSSCIYCECN